MSNALYSVAYHAEVHMRGNGSFHIVPLLLVLACSTSNSTPKDGGVAHESNCNTFEMFEQVPKETFAAAAKERPLSEDERINAATAWVALSYILETRQSPDELDPQAVVTSAGQILEQYSDVKRALSNARSACRSNEQENVVGLSAAALISDPVSCSDNCVLDVDRLIMDIGRTVLSEVQSSEELTRAVQELIAAIKDATTISRMDITTADGILNSVWALLNLTVSGEAAEIIGIVGAGLAIAALADQTLDALALYKGCQIVQRDKLHCCGESRCPWDATCEDGVCVCEDAKFLCVDTSPTGYCANLTTDHLNCGECGHSCSLEAGEYCENRKCITGNPHLCGDGVCADAEYEIGSDGFRSCVDDCCWTCVLPLDTGCYFSYSSVPSCQTAHAAVRPGCLSSGPWGPGVFCGAP